MVGTTHNYEGLRAIAERHGQGHLFQFWPQLDEVQRAELLADVAEIDFELCASLLDEFVRRKPVIPLPERIEAAAILPRRGEGPRDGEYDAARRVGEEAIRGGRVAAFTVAGGQGTRLGFEGPKGAFRISPIRGAPLFQLFAEGLRRVGLRWGVTPAWYIMTSPQNHAETRAFFDAHAFFGLRPADVIFFQQGQMPAFRPDGRMLLSERHRVALSPNGHGGSLRALATSGALADMRRRGVEQISYFQVDNPLVAVIDPLFIGLHVRRGSEMSSKAVRKADDLERVGNFCLADGKLSVIEYSDLPDELARQRNADGTRRFDAGSIAIHILERGFAERVTEGRLGGQLPWHRADKKVSTVDEHGRPVQPAAPNGVKLEMFVFDAIPLARSAMVMYTDRGEEFSPVKNAEGVDSVHTARRDMIRRAAAWLERCGARIPRAADGEPAAVLEISPTFAMDADDLARQLPEPPTIATGAHVLIDEGREWPCADPAASI
ncbi:MAG: putative uridylyltransferase [Phycisphaerae bacterium]|nr:putative uridylyltransferase [Phycisphaerae bacterium]